MTGALLRRHRQLRGGVLDLHCLLRALVAGHLAGGAPQGARRRRPGAARGQRPGVNACRSEPPTWAMARPVVSSSLPMPMKPWTMPP